MTALAETTAGTTAETPVADSERVLQVAGRVFRPVTGYTFPQHQFITAQLGIINAHDVLVARQDDPVRAFLELNLLIAESGRAGHILAAFVVEEGAAWTAPGAVALARFFNGEHTATDMTAMQTAVQELMIGFFAGRGTSSATSPTSSATPTAPVDAPQSAMSAIEGAPV
jgi:hypothetical protein